MPSPFHRPTRPVSFYFSAPKHLLLTVALLWLVIALAASPVTFSSPADPGDLAVDESTTEEPILDEPIDDELIVDTLVTEDLATDELVVDELTVDTIAQKLAQRVQDVHDLSATVTFVQISARNGARSEGEMHLKALFPDLVRVTWHNPEMLRGLVWIVDTQAGRFTQYEPTTGEARHHPLSDVLADGFALPLTPEQLFALPDNEQFQLELVEASDEGEAPFAVVQAVDTLSQKMYRIWVDLTDWLVTRMESFNASGQIELAAQVEALHINQGLTASQVRALPPGTIERSAR